MSPGIPPSCAAFERREVVDGDARPVTGATVVVGDLFRYVPRTKTGNGVPVVVTATAEDASTGGALYGSHWPRCRRVTPTYGLWKAGATRATK